MPMSGVAVPDQAPGSVPGSSGTIAPGAPAVPAPTPAAPELSVSVTVAYTIG
jgi:hypothetical protein